MIVAELVATLGLAPKESEWAKGDKLIEKLHHALEIFVGVEALKGVYEMVHGVVELGSHINDLSQSTGVATKDLQFLGFVAKQNSSDMDQVGSAVGKYSHGLDEVQRKGEGPVGDALRRLGINFNDQGFKANSLSEQVQLISDKLAKLPDGQKKNAIAMDLFGKAGRELIPTLNDLGKNGDELKRSFEDLGGAISDKQIKDLDEFGDEMDRAKFSIGAIKNQIVAQMIPALREMLHGFMEWLKANKQLIATTITGVLNGLATAIRFVGKAIAVVVEVIQWLADHRDVLTAVLAGLGAVISAFAIQAAIDWVLAFWPLVLAVAIIAAVVLAVQKLWKWISDGDDIVARTIRRIFNAFKDLVSTVTDVAKSIREGLEAAFNWVANLPIVKQLRELVGEFLKLSGKPAGSDAAKKALAGTTGGAANDFLNEHPWVARISSALGGGGVNPEKIREDIQASLESSPRVASRDRDSSTTVTNQFGDTHINVDAKGDDADAIASKVRGIVQDVHRENTRQAIDAWRGGSR